jgi:subtilisin family serine protease
MSRRLKLILPGILGLLTACSSQAPLVPSSLNRSPAQIQAQTNKRPVVLKTEIGQLRKYRQSQQIDLSLSQKKATAQLQKSSVSRGGLRAFSTSVPEPEQRIVPLLPPDQLPSPILADQKSPFPALPDLLSMNPLPPQPATPGEIPLAPGQEPNANQPNANQPTAGVGSPSFRYDDLMWHLRKTQTPKAWQITRGNPEQIVAVIDTGLDYFHPAFRGRALMGFDFASNDPDPMDEAAHGTHVAGILAGNDANIQGIAPNVKVLAIKVFSAQGFAQGDFALARAIHYAVENGASVINMSLGSPTLYDCGAYSDMVRAVNSAIDEAYSRGVSVVTAAGNEGLDFINGRCSVQQNVNQIPVIATNEVDQLAGFSNAAGNSHPKAISAPGVNIFSSIPMRLVCNEQRCEMPYDYMDGTSMASPVVAGALALIRSAMYEDYVRTIQRRNSKVPQGAQAQPVLRFRDFFHEQAAFAQAQLNLSLRPAQLAERLLLSHTNKPSRKVPQGLIYEGSRDPVFGFGRLDIGASVEAASRVFTLAGL